MNTRAGRPRAAGPVVVGAVCGLAWAAGFRSYMVELAGPASAVGWAGTFGAVLLPGAIGLLVTEGLGGGAIVVALLGIGGGYALSGRGPLWPRLLCGALTAALLTALALATPSIAGAHLALTAPRGAWVAVLVVSFVAVLGLASSIPHRPVVDQAT